MNKLSSVRDAKVDGLGIGDRSTRERAREVILQKISQDFCMKVSCYAES